MTLGPVFTKLNGVWYQSASIWAPDRSHFICFDDREPPELVMKKVRSVNYAIGILKQYTDHFFITRRTKIFAGRCFSKPNATTSMTFCESSSVFFYPDGLKAPEKAIEFDEKYSSKPNREGDYYDFEDMPRVLDYYRRLTSWKEIKK